MMLPLGAGGVLVRDVLRQRCVGSVARWHSAGLGPRRRASTIVAILMHLLLVSEAGSAQTRQIAGTVTSEGGDPIAGITVIAWPVGVPDCCVIPPMVPSGAGGAFVLSVPTGIFALVAETPPPLGLVRKRVDVRDANTSSVELRVPDEKEGSQQLMTAYQHFLR